MSQEHKNFLCNLKLCNFPITSSAFIQYHCALFAAIVKPSFFHTKYMTKHWIYKTCSITRYPCCHSVSLYNITIMHSAQQQFYCYMCNMLSPFKNDMLYSVLCMGLQIG